MAVQDRVKPQATNSPSTDSNPPCSRFRSVAETFGTALRRAYEAAGLSQRQLGELVAEDIGRGGPGRAASVGGWLGANLPDPDVVFAIERVLNLPPGALSRLLGYLPMLEPPTSARDAIERDPDISDDVRASLIAAYDAAVARRKRR